MKILIIFSLLAFSFAEISAEDINEPIDKHYHGAVGIKRAAEIKAIEEAAVKDGLLERNNVSLRSHAHYGGLLITLHDGNQSVCGASLISNTRMLTAAQCWFDGVHQAVEFEVVLASLTLYYGGLRFSARDVVTHPAYDFRTHQNDIAIIRHHYILFNTFYVDAIKIPVWDINYVGWMAKTLTYNTENMPYGRLQERRLRVISNLECRDFYGSSLVTGNTICGKASSLSEPCQGDYGAPLQVWGRLVGIKSFISSRGCDSWSPVGFTRVASYLSWIRSHL